MKIGKKKKNGDSRKGKDVEIRLEIGSMSKIDSNRSDGTLNVVVYWRQIMLDLALIWKMRIRIG